MNLEPLKEKLGDETFAQLSTFVTDLTNQRDAARQESISGRKALKAENETLKSVKSKLFERLGITDDDEIDSLPDSKGQAEAARQFEAKVKRLERELAAANEARSGIEERFKSTRMDAALSKAIGSHDFIDRDLTESFIRSNSVWEDDQVMFKAGDGRLIPLDDGVKWVAQTKPHLLKAQGAGGSGHSPSARGDKGASVMTRGEFEALSPAAKVEFSKSGGQLT